MRSGRRELHPDTPLPGHVHRRHEHPDTSDNYGMLHRLSREPVGADGILAGDINGQLFWSRKDNRYVIAGAHWRAPGPNGYTRIRRRLGRGTRPMTTKELHRTSWTWEQAQRWRRPNGERLRTLDELYAMAVLLGVVIVLELKNPAFTYLNVATDLVAAARRHDHPAWFMVLDDLRPRYKVAAVRQASGQIALIFGRDGTERPGDWDRWTHYPNQIWGPDRARRWLPA